MDKKLKRIYSAFEGKLVGGMQMKIYVCEALSVMPPDIIRFITANCWFISSLEDAWSFVIKGNELKNQYIVFLSDDLLRQHDNQVHFSIAHEIGHIILRHRNSILVSQTKAEIRKQEKQADEFAKKYAAK